jgi:hypothetical protein
MGNLTISTVFPRERERERERKSPSELFRIRAKQTQARFSGKKQKIGLIFYAG